MCVSAVYSVLSRVPWKKNITGMLLGWDSRRQSVNQILFRETARIFFFQIPSLKQSVWLMLADPTERLSVVLLFRVTQPCGNCTSFFRRHQLRTGHQIPTISFNACCRNLIARKNSGALTKPTSLYIAFRSYPQNWKSYFI